MSFYNALERYKDFDFQAFFDQITPERVLAALGREQLSATDFLTLLSPAASTCLEQMARKAQKLTAQYFGHTIQLFIPLYISNFCTNECVYCGFHRGNNITPQEIESCRD